MRLHAQIKGTFLCFFQELIGAHCLSLIHIYLLLGRSSSRDVSKVESRLTDLTPDQLFIVDRAIRIVLEAFDCPDGEEMPPDHQHA